MNSWNPLLCSTANWHAHLFLYTSTPIWRFITRPYNLPNNHWETKLSHKYKILVSLCKLLSQSMQTPYTSHMDTLFHCSKVSQRYHRTGHFVKGFWSTHSSGIFKLRLISRRFATGYLVLFWDSPITWKSKKQTTISKSSLEAEYKATYQAPCVRLLEELHVLEGLLQLL